MDRAGRYAAVVAVTVCVGSAACGPTLVRTPDAPTAAHGGTLWLMFVDDLHLDFRSTGYIRTALDAVATELIRDGDTFAIARSNTALVSVGPTASRSLLGQAIKETSGAGLSPRDIVELLLRPRTLNEVTFRASLALTAAHEMLAAAEAHRPGRKALIYLSNGYGFDAPPPGLFRDRTVPPAPVDPKDATPETLRAQFAGLIDRAKSLGVPVFAIEVRRVPWDGPVEEQAVWEKYLHSARGTLRALGEQTDGRAILEARNPTEIVKGISDAIGLPVEREHKRRATPRWLRTTERHAADARARGPRQSEGVRRRTRSSRTDATASPVVDTHTRTVGETMCAMSPRATNESR
jgi:hypothetical protein